LYSQLTYCIVCLFLLISSTLQSQSIEQDSISNTFEATVPVHFFIKNNEYFSPFTDGFTGIGVIAQPCIAYRFDQKSKLSVGVHVLKFSGLNSFSEIIPLIRFQTNIVKPLTLIFGSIDGAQQHQLSEPFYRYDLNFQNRVEYGLQALIKTKTFRSDTWLNWEQFIERNDPFPEELFVGNVSHLQIFPENKIQLDLNSELLISHLGGQIDLATNPDRTLFNYSISPSVGFQTDKLSVDFKPAYYYFTVVNGNQLSNGNVFLAQDTGSGFWYNLMIEFNSIDIAVGYWSATNFYSSIGEALFFSYNDSSLELISSSRNLWTNSIHYDWQAFDYLLIDAGYRGYYDADNNQFDYTIYLNCNVKIDFLF